MRIVVTGGDGFIGANLRLRLRELRYDDVISVNRNRATELATLVNDADFVFHLAGVNRPADLGDFERDNVGLTTSLCNALLATGRRVPVAFSSSTQATLDNPYGHSKLAAESALEQDAERTGAPVFVLRLTNVFGKWARPNYNSAVATFCYNIARGLPISVHDGAAPLRLVYVDDVIATLIGLLSAGGHGVQAIDVNPVYTTTVAEVVSLLRAFAECRTTRVLPPVGTGLSRVLYATYVSYLPPELFSYPLQEHVDPRGRFVELLKTPTSGQFSFFTAEPGVTRGEHYHHTKTEKFIVVQGAARFEFRHVGTGARHEVVVSGSAPCVVDTVPGWAHNITNVGTDELIVMLWANELFDPQAPDTISCKVAADS